MQELRRPGLKAIISKQRASHCGMQNEQCIQRLGRRLLLL
jgi:hypothetical protein